MPPKKTKKEEVQVSFLPEVTEEELVSQHKRTAIFITIFIALASFLLFVILALMPWLNVKRQVGGVNYDVSQLDRGLQDVPAAEAQRIQDVALKVSEAKKRLEGRPAFQNALTLVENSAINEVVFKTLALDDKGSLMLTGVAQSYRALAKQILAWRVQPQIKDVRLTSASASPGIAGAVSGVQFNASLTLTPEALQWSP
ncbi:MAG: hypothetical protein UX98_C0002G0016 [Parcubacteria group bacterium GW2011_GWA2_47_26]|nr:MAG: hypothetical protein UX98_C0002G0016 [Parcubacteria group bacterium GW2011_GWA2_47_26]